MVASPLLLRTIGLKFARSVLDKRLDPEQKLWREVVINAFDETLITSSDRKPSLIKIAAHNWIISESDDFRKVCEWGTLDPEDMKQCYIRALQRRAVTFTQRQIAWQKYDSLYRNMTHEPLKEIKKIKRKKVNTYRDKVNQIPTTLISSIVISVLV
tara:strand:+ start:531 stop:998 length:468 start_codon:yes stop_codon:yes gene_type:complete